MQESLPTSRQVFIKTSSKVRKEKSLKGFCLGPKTGKIGRSEKRCPMRKKIALALAMILLAQGQVLYAKTEKTSPPAQEPAKIEAVIPPEEVRNQDFLVPTSQGVLPGNLKEAQIIQELSVKPLTELASHYLVGDFDSGTILEGHEMNQVVAMASTSKLVSLYVVYDAIKAGKIKLEDPVVMDEEVTQLTGSTFKSKLGDQFTVDQLIDAALIISGNDAITALGKKVSGSTPAFVQAMNEKCQSLGLTHAHMINPHGLTDYALGDYNKMTVQEMFQLVRHLLKDHPDIINRSKKPLIDNLNRGFLAYNTNPLLGIVKGVDGLKTGYTNAAGRCLVATALTPAIQGVTEPMRLISITMGSPTNMDRFVVAKRLMDHSLKTYSKRVLAQSDQAMAKVPVIDGMEREAEVYPAKDLAMVWDAREKLTRKLDLKPLTPPLKAKTKVGQALYYKNGELVASLPLEIRKDLKQENILVRLQKGLYQAFLQIEKI